MSLYSYALDAEKGEAEKHGHHQHGDQQRAPGSLGGPDGEHDGQTTADQDRGVGGAECGIDRFAGRTEISEVLKAVDQIGAKQSAEEHDFGAEEDPHAEVGGVALLLLGGEVVEQRRIVSFTVDGDRAIVQREPPLF